MKNLLVVLMTLCFALPSFGEIASGNGWVISDDGVITISEDFENCSGYMMPWRNYRKDIKKAIISDGVTVVGNYAFSICVNLHSVIIGDDVTSIGYRAFYGCDDLTSISIGKNVTSIKNDFRLCRNLTRVEYAGTIVDWLNINFENNACNPLIYTPAHLYIDEREVVEVVVPDDVMNITDPIVLKSKLSRDMTYIVPCALYETYVAAGLTTKRVDMVRTEAIAETCTTDGNLEYYTCTCGRYYSDEYGANEVEEDSWVTTAYGHIFTNYYYNFDATTETDGTETAECDYDCGATDSRISEGTKLQMPTSMGDIILTERPKIEKTIEVGRVVIIRDGKKYELDGREIK